MRLLKTTTCLMLLLLCVDSHAGAISIEELSWLQKQQLQNQVEQIDQLARLNLGQPVRGNPDDLELLQRIIYKGLIKPDDHMTLQALGAVLGNVMVSDLGLEWKSYRDELGKSRAACIPKSTQCLFPITMLSRRMEVGLLPDVKQIYAETRDMVETYRKKMEYLPKDSR